ncbi:MAG TPA: hypothetical protein GX399_05475 [Xanthomonadaceae bacterium]|nr:hypothetical protein [Xanthomonadaceae bacterium]
MAAERQQQDQQQCHRDTAGLLDECGPRYRTQCRFHPESYLVDWISVGGWGSGIAAGLCLERGQAFAHLRRNDPIRCRLIILAHDKIFTPLEFQKCPIILSLLTS